MEPEAENKWARLNWLKGDAAAPPRAANSTQVQAPTVCVLNYTPPLGRLGIGVLFFGAGSLYMHHLAVTNERGLIINGLIELDVWGAKIFYWSCAAAAAAFVVWCIFIAMPQVFIRRQIRLEEYAITLPGWGYSAAHYRIPWSEIESVTRTTYGKVTFLKIRHRGQGFSVNSTWLPSNLDVEIIEAYLQRKCEPLM